MLILASPTADTPTIEQLEVALERLEPNTPGRWGVMDAAAMVDHCRRFVDLYLGRVEVSTPIRWAARALGPMFLRRVLSGSPAETPRNLRTLGPLKVSAGEVSPGQANPGDEAELNAGVMALREALAEVKALGSPYRNPLYGPMDPESARALVRHHTAHHFHQFGLLD